jgi:hypothetical protein
VGVPDWIKLPIDQPLRSANLLAGNGDSKSVT